MLCLCYVGCRVCLVYLFAVCGRSAGACALRRVAIFAFFIVVAFFIVFRVFHCFSLFFAVFAFFGFLDFSGVGAAALLLGLRFACCRVCRLYGCAVSVRSAGDRALRHVVTYAFFIDFRVFHCVFRAFHCFRVFRVV